MKSLRSRLLLLLAGLVVIVGLPLAGKWARRNAVPRCELDGLHIQSLYQVRVVDRVGKSHYFCCIGCARLWLARAADEPATVMVTDEASGKEIDVRTAHFVRSRVVTSPITRNRIHAFGARAAAQEHERSFDGRELTDTERPFPVEPNSSPEDSFTSR